MDSNIWIRYYAPRLARRNCGKLKRGTQWRKNEKPRSDGTRITRQSEGMSCSAWRRLVQPAIIKPKPAENSDRNFIKCRTVACPKEILFPSAVTTRKPSSRFPTVACQEELSM